MSCPGEDLVYNPTVQRCDEKKNSVCPGDDLRGHIDKNMIFPELIVHSTCGYRHRNGDYEYLENKKPFMTLDLCGFKQRCTDDGKLSISQCANGKLWNNETDSCVPTEDMTVCEPSTKWTKQNDVDLQECIGKIDGRCEIGFVNVDRAKKYCEFTDECVGIKEMPCNQISMKMNCIGTFWRPFLTFVQSDNSNGVYIFQRESIQTNIDEVEENETNNPETAKYKVNC